MSGCNKKIRVRGKGRRILFALLVMLWAGSALTQEGLRVMALFPDKAMVEIDGNTHLLRKGTQGPRGMVLLSADAHEAVIEIDGRAQTYTLGSRVSNNFAVRQVAEVIIRRDSNGSFNTVGSINGRNVNMLVDTGATSVAMSEVEAQRLGISYRLKGEKVGVGTASGRAMGYAVNLDRVQVGAITLQNVEAIVVEGSSPVDVLLGMSFLNRVEMDNQGAVMVLRSKF